MGKRLVRTMVAAGLCAATLSLAACGGGGSGGGASGGFCREYASLADVSGTSEEALRDAADRFRAVAAIAPDEIKDELEFLADSEEAVANGEYVDNDAASAAADRADEYAQSACS